MPWWINIIPTVISKISGDKFTVSVSCGYCSNLITLDLKYIIHITLGPLM